MKLAATNYYLNKGGFSMSLIQKRIFIQCYQNNVLRAATNADIPSR